MNKPINVILGDNKLEKEFNELKQGSFQDKQLSLFIDRAITDLKENPACGIKIPRRIWPKVYLAKYGITNLWKYDLPNAWRLIYTIKEDDVRILNVILEWFNHPEYERRFAY